MIGLASEALDRLRRAEWNRLRAEDPAAGARFKGLRFSLRRRAKGLSADQRGLIEQLADDNRAVYGNARLEAMNSTVRLISHRSRGFRRVDSLTVLIRVVCGKIPVALPT